MKIQTETREQDQDMSTSGASDMCSNINVVGNHVKENVLGPFGTVSPFNFKPPYRTFWRFGLPYLEPWNENNKNQKNPDNKMLSEGRGEWLGGGWARGIYYMVENLCQICLQLASRNLAGNRNNSLNFLITRTSK